jgi:hypothetical protein
MRKGVSTPRARWLLVALLTVRRQEHKRMSRTLAAVVAATAFTVALAAPAGATPPPTPDFTGVPLEGYAPSPDGSCLYDQRSDYPRRGVQRFREMVRDAYPDTFNFSWWRTCNDGSEHDTGLAWDWGVTQIGTTPTAAEKARGDELVSWLLATVDGQAHMRFRRLGIRYIIWYDRIWIGDGPWQRYDAPPYNCSGVTDCHRDHVHFTFGVAGGNGTTSWWDRSPRPQGWTSIVHADYDGDGDDEVAFYRNLDGRLTTYEMRADGTLGTRLSSFDVNDDWSELFAGDFDGDGDDELGFYRDRDGRTTVYEGNGNGTLGSLLESYLISPTWTEIHTADFNADGNDELGFYRSDDGRLMTYEATANGRLGTQLLSRDVARGWGNVLGMDFDGDGDGELTFYRPNDGRIMVYESNRSGDLGTRWQSFDVATGWRELVGGDLDGDGDGELSFYRSRDGLYVTYEGGSNGTLGTRLSSLDLFP